MSPAGTGLTALTDRLAEALARRLVPLSTSRRLASALLPVVREYGDQRAAEELTEVAHRLDDAGDEAVEVALGGAAYVHRVLCDRADALRGEAGR
jgi:tetraacyldisaccharide-1-P 4'-kinase